MVSFGRLVSYRTLFQAEVFNFDHWLIDSPTENSVLREAAKIELACQQALHFTWRAKQTAGKRASERASGKALALASPFASGSLVNSRHCPEWRTCS